MAINNSWQLVPWADALYGCDANWWKINRTVADNFAGLKISQDAKCERLFSGLIRVVHCRRNVDGRPAEILVDVPAVIGWGGNSGFQALNLAVQFGAKRIIMAGFDMTLKAGIHWHGKHPKGLNNPQERNVNRWRSALDAVAPQLSALGITVINASQVSALTAYTKMSLEEALGALTHSRNGMTLYGAETRYRP